VPRRTLRKVVQKSLLDAASSRCGALVMLLGIFLLLAAVVHLVSLMLVSRKDSYPLLDS